MTIKELRLMLAEAILAGDRIEQHNIRALLDIMVAEKETRG